MSSKFRARTPHHRLATTQDLQNAIKRGPLAESENQLPCQPRSFLAELPPVGVTYQPQQDITKQLKHIIDDNFYATSFENAIKEVSKQRIPELDRIKTLDQFYFYVDALVTWIPEIRVWDWYGEVLHERTVYLRITQFYYYFNQPQLEALQSPIEPQEGKALLPISLWLRNFAVEWGSFLNTSASAEYLSSFKYAPEYAWQDYEKSPEEYPNFNAFFARQFKDINVQRPVAQPNNDKVIVFPAESTFVGQWAVSTKVGPPLAAPPSIVVKNIEWSIRELLQDSDYADAFEGGIFCHSFLNTYDYHRLHTPVAGKVLEAKFIPGQVYLEVELTVNADEEGNKEPANIVTPKRLLDAEDNTGYQFVQCRGLLVLESSIGKVAILPMGMAQVSSVVFVTPRDEGHQPILLTAEEQQKLDYNQQVCFLNEKVQGCLVGKNLSKGEMFSYFQFGGSDCVMVFERKANVNITAQTNVHYPIRSQYAIANG
ncbi:phosphatidylserine decarboxylase [Zooshikella ganghwensis]|uniref:Phosphatidylserine decarboxylase n=1 Tax=Zooshikella ganghwensis TaxID=202772 RepID=A0A4P9VK23_9GAMM|nr:phosphatidylserine decarboxylase [Zooshikella ganghwensis]RDH43026.1 phosphatidylserine decarboxylase [Zooshikella ganghwensis]